MKKINGVFDDEVCNAAALTADSLIHSKEDAAAIIEGEGLSFIAFQEDNGYFPTYGGGELSDWIFEMKNNKKAPI